MGGEEGHGRACAGDVLDRCARCAPNVRSRVKLPPCFFPEEATRGDHGVPEDLGVLGLTPGEDSEETARRRSWPT